MQRMFLYCCWAAAILGWRASQADAADPSPATPVVQPAVPAQLEIGPAVEGTGMHLRGRDARQQAVVTGVLASGQQVDVTHSVKYSVEPAGILEIDAAGLMRPLADGQATLKVLLEGGPAAEIPVKVDGIAKPELINFKNQIVPIFTKLGCNGGGCHGKASGQNGFKLSLLGFYPEDDYEFLVKEGRGRRLFPAAPGESLLLTKPIGRSPHGGGKRMEVDSDDYRLLYRWIEQGMPQGTEADPVVTSIRCYPEQRILDRGSQQQISVIATYSDGRTEDVTRTALYEPNDTELAEAGKSGLVKIHESSGEVAIMARYQGQVATFRATIPMGVAVNELPPVRNFIDQAVFNKLKVLGIPPSKLSDDATFLRRVYVDITGTLPTEAEVREFVANTDAAKRDKLIDKLLDSPQYADYFANKWNMVLRNKKRQGEDQLGTLSFHQWIWDSLYENKPYDQFVRELLTASGDLSSNPAVVWYREVEQVNEQVEDTAQLFLGIRIQCARCHHHPFEKWSQNDYYSLAAFFSRIGKKNPNPDFGPAGRDRRIFHQVGLAQAQNPRNGQQMKPAGLGGASLAIPEDRDPRVQLADWMADRNNPFFAKSLVNRYWKHFFDRGIVEPEDDMRETNPPTNPELLNGLSQQFIESGFDLKGLVRTICQSSTYQLSSMPNDYNLKDKQNFSRYYPRRMTAEVLYDAFHQVSGSSQNYGGLPPGTRAIQLPDVSQGPYFLKVFGQPQADTACECERSQEANLAQSLHLLNSSEVQTKIAGGGGRAALMAAAKERPAEEKVKELYRWVYSREPDAEEMQIALNHLKKHEANPQLAYEDIVWALLNTKEFLFNH